jgi:hypothetical protein
MRWQVVHEFLLDRGELRFTGCVAYRKASPATRRSELNLNGNTKGGS